MWCRVPLCFFTCLVFAAAPLLAQSENALPIAASGETVLTRTTRGVGVNVVFRSAEIKPGDSLHPAWESFENHTFTALSDLKISIAGNAVLVPHAAFADLLEPHNATLRGEQRMFVLRINGGDGAESYVVDVLFDKHGVTRRRVYSTVVKTVLASETRYFYHAF